MDIKKGDTIRYSYYVYGVQCITTGIVSAVNEDGSCVIDQGDRELIVEKKSILTRYPREDETTTVKAPMSKSEEEHFNEMHHGISIHKKETPKNTTTSSESVKNETSNNANKKFNHFGGK